MRKLVKYWVLSALVLISLCFHIEVAFAAPSMDIVREEQQPSGQVFNVKQGGDEFFNYNIAESGELVVKGSDGYWYYGEASADGVKQGTTKYLIGTRPENALTKDNLKYLRENRLNYLREKLGDQAMIPTSETGQTTEKKAPALETLVAKPTGPQNMIVVLVSFTDVQIIGTESAWGNKCFGTNGKTIRNYYSENSNGSFYFKPAVETNGTPDDGIISIKMPYVHPNYGDKFDDPNMNKLILDIFTAVDENINYASYDTNGNGIIDLNELHILTIIAGYEAASTDIMPSVWAHRGSLSYTGIEPKWDGVSVSGYTQMGEINVDSSNAEYIASIGTACHELGHDLGLDDLYDTDGSSSGVGMFSLMGSGNWGYVMGENPATTPTHLDAWSKMLLGFVTPTVATKGDYNVVCQTSGYNVIKVPTEDPLQYFLVENRQLSGFDAGLAPFTGNGKGILIWHIDENILSDTVVIGTSTYTIFSGNMINSDEAHKGVDVEEADETIYHGSNLDKDSLAKATAYFYVGNNTVFSPTSTPASILYDGTDSLISIIVQSAPANTMVINVNHAPVAWDDTYSVKGGETLTISAPGLLVNDIDSDGDSITAVSINAASGSALGTLITNSDGSLSFAASKGTGGNITFTYKATDGKISSTNAATVTINIQPSTSRVSFLSNGGSSVAEQIVAFDGTAMIPTQPTRTGYRFDGWYSDAIFETSYEFTSVVIMDITLYAKWTQVNHTVSFNTNGGSTVDSQTVGEGATVTPPSIAMTKTGYTFTGWYRDASLTTAYDFTAAVTESITIYAKWALETHTVSFHTNGGSPVDSQTVEEGATATQPATEPIMEGYNFAGWYRDAGLTIVYDFTSAIMEDITLYANWTQSVTYTVIFNTNGGSIVANQTAVSGAAIYLPVAPTKEGYLFAGWYYDDSLTTLYDFTTAIIADITIYAKWTPVIYTISFNTNGGSEITGITATYNNTITAPSAPTKPGYSFAGWYMDTDLTTAYDYNTAISANMILYAKWTLVSSNDGYIFVTPNQTPAPAPIPVDTSSNIKTIPVQVIEDRSTSIPVAIITIASTDIAKDKVNEVIAVVSDTTKSLEFTVDADSIKGGAGSLSINANAITMNVPFSIIDFSNVEAGTYVKLAQSSSTKDVSLEEINSIGEVLHFNLGLYNSDGTKLSDIHEFAQGKVKISIILTEEQINRLDTSKLVAYYYNEVTKSWETVGGRYDKTTKTFSFETEHFSKYTIAETISAVVYTISFNSQGGSTVASIAVSENQGITAPKIPIKKGYTFSGWYLEKKGQIAWDFTSDIVTKDTVLYAKWVKNPAKPTSVKAVSKSSSSILISWKAVTGASGYRIYRSVSLDGKYSYVSDTERKSYVNKELRNKKVYYYKVRAYIMVDGKKVYGEYSTIVSAKPL